MSQEFTDEEKKSLAPFFTNLDRPVFGLKLPQEVAGALFSRYSRSTKSLRRTFLDEFLGDPELALTDLLGAQTSASDNSAALKKARAFYDRVLVGYGDDSVAQLGGAHIACENISNVAAKILEDARIGIAPLEKSTRYVRFDQKEENGHYLFYREPRIMASRHGQDYLETMNLLFETYSRQMEPMLEFVRKSLPIEEIELRDPTSGTALSYKEAQKNEKLKRWAETAYRSTVRAQACDILRAYLPAATLTNVGLFGVGQAFEYLLSKLYSHELSEAKELAGAMHRELNDLIPSFVKRARFNEYIADTFSAARAISKKVVKEPAQQSKDAVTLVDYDAGAEEKIIASLLYPHAQLPLKQLRSVVAEMSEAERQKVLGELLSKRRHRRDKPGRAFENVYYTFDILGNLGLYRDLHRHRILTQERQDFTTAHGYDTPQEIVEAGFKGDFDLCMNRAAELYEQIHKDLPAEAQYVVPFAFKIRWYMKMNLREAVHLGELRTMPQGHPDYRFIVQEMWKKIHEVHPSLAQYAKFIDWKTYRLGRLQSEMRTEFKKSAMQELPVTVGMPTNSYDWKRFWCPREGRLNLSDDGYLWDPDSEMGSIYNPDVVSFDQISQAACLVLLGEPGMGKSTAIQSHKAKIDGNLIARGDSSLWIDLRAYQTDVRLVQAIFQAPVFQEWLNGTHELHLFLDSLDECLLRMDTVANLLVDELKKYPVNRLRLRIACRTAEWPNGLENGLKQIWEQDEVKVYELAPLRRVDVVTAAKSSRLDANAFLSEIGKKDIVPLAIKPITLRFLVNTFLREGQFPSRQVDLYKEGCRILCEEISESRRDVGRVGTLSAQQRLSLAARIAAVTIFSNRYAIWTSIDTGDVPPEDVKLLDLCGTPDEMDVSDKQIKEVLATGLFSSRGSYRMGWAHQTYAEFLAALYLVQQNMTTTQIMSLLAHPDDPDSKIVPQLHETAAWLGGMLPDVFREITKRDPDLLLRSDVATADAKDREVLVCTLLKAFEDEKMHDRRWDMHRQYRKLMHPKLQQQLEPYIQDRRKGTILRRAAIDIAEACELKTLQNMLADIALDVEEPGSIRVYAAYAVGQIGDDTTKLKLRALAFGTGRDDPDDELKGCALRALWPNGIGAKELFSVLTPPKSNLHGAYRAFISGELPNMLDPSHLPDALVWVAAKGPRHELDFSVRRLINAIMLSGWKHLDSPGVLEAYAQASLSRLRHYERLVEEQENKSLNTQLRQDSGKRRKLIEAMVLQQSLAIKDVTEVGDWIWRVATSQDVLWMIGNLHALENEQKKRLWCRMISLSLDRTDPRQVDAVLVGCDEEPTLAAEFKWLLTPTVLGSPAAKKMKADFLQWQEREKKIRERPLLDPPPTERVARLLESYEAGNLAAWWQLNMELTLEPDSTHYENELESDLTVLPGWKEAGADTRRRLVEGAKNYLLKQDPESNRWLGTSTFYRPAAAGYRAFRLVLGEDKDFILNLPLEVWKKWAPVILSYPTSSGNDEEQPHLNLVSLTYRFAQNEIVETLMRLIDKENEGGGHVFINRKIQTCWDDRIAEAILDKLKNKQLSPQNTKVLLEQLLDHGSKDAESFAKSLLKVPLPTVDPERLGAIFAACALLAHTKDAGWSVVWPAMMTDVEFAKEVVAEVAHEDGWGNKAGIADRLTEEQLCDLYIWLAHNYSYSEDLQRDHAGVVTKRESIAHWRDTILNNLKMKGTKRACEAIRRIQESLPTLSWLKWTLLDAEALARRNTWTPLQATDFLKFTRHAETRLVQNGNQLLGVVIESLTRLEQKLQGETPASPFLWNKIGKTFRPKDESSLCDFIKLHLEDDLKQRGIVVNREVQIHRGERTDIHITAVTPGRSKESYASVTVIVEVKGCWHPELATAMDTQLCGQYLENNACQHGLYLVGWFNCNLWDDADYRKTQSSTISLNELREELASQAASLSKNKRLIKSYVINAALNTLDRKVME